MKHYSLLARKILAWTITPETTESFLISWNKLCKRIRGLSILILTSLFDLTIFIFISDLKQIHSIFFFCQFLNYYRPFSNIYPTMCQVEYWSTDAKQLLNKSLTEYTRLWITQLNDKQTNQSNYTINNFAERLGKQMYQIVNGKLKNLWIIKILSYLYNLKNSMALTLDFKRIFCVTQYNLLKKEKLDLQGSSKQRFKHQNRKQKVKHKIIYKNFLLGADFRISHEKLQQFLIERKNDQRIRKQKINNEHKNFTIL